MYLPGKRSLYLSQSLQFKNPAYIGNTVVVTGIVTAKSESTKILDIEITIRSEDLILVSGLAKVQILDIHNQPKPKIRKIKTSDGYMLGRNNT
jgi:predicted acyltransferase (DUF342 family)